MAGILDALEPIKDRPAPRRPRSPIPAEPGAPPDKPVTDYRQPVPPDGVPPVDGDEALRIVSAMIRDGYYTAQDSDLSEAERKHAAVRLGVAIDKLIGLTAKPIAPAVANPQDERQGLRALGLRILAFSAVGAPEGAQK